jgi:hypothetical protein
MATPCSVATVTTRRHASCAFATASVKYGTISRFSTSPCSA